MDNFEDDLDWGNFGDENDEIFNVGVFDQQDVFYFPSDPSTPPQTTTTSTSSSSSSSSSNSFQKTPTIVPSPSSCSSYAQSPNTSAPDFIPDDNDFYYQCIFDSLNKFRAIVPCIRKLSVQDLFAVERNDKGYIRCRLNKSHLEKYWSIFPWISFQLKKGIRIREGIPDQGIVDQIVSAMNYFFSRTYFEIERDHLQQIFLRLETERDNPKNLLTRALEVHRSFLVLSEGLVDSPVKLNCSPPKPPPVTRLEETVNSLSQRVEVLEHHVGLGETSSSLKRSRLSSANGGDRAHWERIRDADYATRHQWCRPGEVFGLYSDGVGQLRPRDALIGMTWSSVVVFSVAPDTVEEHPNPKEKDHYVRVVMIGEAPVRLRNNQIQKLIRLNCNCYVYVNKKAEINVRSIDQPLPTGGVIFATTRWNPSAVCNGVPMFQGVPGVCAKLIPITNTNTATIDVQLRNLFASLRL